MNIKALIRGAAVCFTVGMGLAACTSPVEQPSSAELREQLRESHRAYLDAVAAGGVLELSRTPSDVEAQLTEERIEQLDQRTGPTAYDESELPLDDDLIGSEASDTLRLSLEQAVRLAVEHNIDLRLARLTPGIAQTQVTQAEAAFDAVFFTDVSWGKLDTPRPGGTIGGLTGNQESEDFSLSTGIRKPLTSGGSVEVAMGVDRQAQDPTILATPSFYTNSVSVTVTQPLLRGFGSEVNRAQIELATSARRSQAQALRQALLDTVVNVEAAYWNLVFARQSVLIQARLLERTTSDRDRLQRRGGFDASPVEITEANSLVELRRADLIRSRAALRQASDTLKRLLNADDLSVAGETLILPTDRSLDEPIEYSLLDAVTSALRHRPEVDQALHAITDASIRQRVADNQRLPELNLAGTLRYNGSNDEVDAAFDQLEDANFIDYLLSAQFEMPIGNRAAEARYEQRQLERQQSVLNYQVVAKDVVLEVKNALRDLTTAYELIGATRAARRAAADQLRAIAEQEEAGVALTPDFLLDRKLATQARLADAETQEIQALTDYQTAIANLFRATGTLLERNGIEFVE